MTWVISLLGVLSVGIYAFVRGKNPQGQVGFMYEIFQRNSQVQMFVAAFERFQREVFLSILFPESVTIGNLSIINSAQLLWNLWS